MAVAPELQRPKLDLLLDQAARWLMPAVAVCILAAVVFSVIVTRSWPFVQDAPLIHYVVFLMDHGKAPYRDIVEMNMPGTYMIDWAIVHTLGPGASGWWWWDVSSGLVAMLATTWLAGPKARAAGLAGGALFYLFHVSNGIAELGQRDWIVAVLLLLAFAFLFEAIRKRQPAWLCGAMFFCMIAVTIKPPVAAILVFLFVAACWKLRSRLLAVTAWSVAGIFVPTAASVLFLVRWGVTHDFLTILHGLVPYYAGLQKRSYLSLILRAEKRPMLPLIAGAVFLFWKNRSWRNWESILLVAGVLAGLALDLIQRKGFLYHIYPLQGFLLVWMMYEVARGLRPARVVGAVMLLAVALFIVPLMAKNTRSASYPLETINSLKSDLGALGGSQLSGKVQCLDMTKGGCINVLDQMQLVQSTGFIYDYYLFPQAGNTLTAGLQSRFLREVTANPPTVFVLSSDIWPGDKYGYGMLANWPAFEQLLLSHYHLQHEVFRRGHGHASGYRLYQLNQPAGAISE